MSSNRILRAALASAALSLGHAAMAETGRSGSIDLRLSTYRPRVDAEFNGAATPWADVFGTNRSWMFKADLARTLWHDIGTLEAVVGIGYYEQYGYGLISDTDSTGTVFTTRSADRTAFKMIPLSLGIQYRFDWLSEKWNIPLAPYARFSLERYQWWINDADGETSSSLDGKDGTGATNGYSYTGGLALLLDILDPSLAREMDQDTGINDTYLFVDLTRTKVDDFGSSKSFDLSDERTTVTAGLLFVF